MWLPALSSVEFLLIITLPCGLRVKRSSFLKICQHGNPYVLYPLQCSQLLYSGLQVITRPLSELHTPLYTVTVPQTHSCMERLQYSMWRCVLFLLNWKTV